MRIDQPDWVRSPYESRPETYFGCKYRQWSRPAGARDILVLTWIGIVVVAALVGF
jgi:hypothetical protein